MPSRSVLIVDDSVVSRMILRKYIAAIRPGWMCVEVCNGEDALVVAGHLQFSLAIVDIHMPGIDGLDTADSLRAVQPELVISVLTGTAPESARARASDLKAHIFEKPINEEKARAIVALLDAGR